MITHYQLMKILGNLYKSIDEAIDPIESEICEREEIFGKLFGKLQRGKNGNEFEKKIDNLLSLLDDITDLKSKLINTWNMDKMVEID